MEKDSNKKEYAYVKITEDKVREMENVLLNMGNLDDLKPSVIVHELLGKVFGVKIPRTSVNPTFTERFSEIECIVRFIVFSKVSSGKPALTGMTVEYASPDDGICEDYVVREEVKDGDVRFWFSYSYDKEYDYDKDEDGIASGPYSFRDISISDMLNIIYSAAPDIVKYELDGIMTEAYRMLDSISDVTYLKNPTLVSIDHNGKWYNEVISRVYRRKIYGNGNSYNLDDVNILERDLMRLVDAVVESKGQ